MSKNRNWSKHARQAKTRRFDKNDVRRQAQFSEKAIRSRIAEYLCEEPAVLEERRAALRAYFGRGTILQRLERELPEPMSVIGRLRGRQWIISNGRSWGIHQSALDAATNWWRCGVRYDGGTPAGDNPDGDDPDGGSPAGGSPAGGTPNRARTWSKHARRASTRRFDKNDVRRQAQFSERYLTVEEYFLYRADRGLLANVILRRWHNASGNLSQRLAMTLEPWVMISRTKRFQALRLKTKGYRAYTAYSEWYGRTPIQLVMKVLRNMGAL